MNIEITVSITETRYGNELAKSSCLIDADFLDCQTVADLADRIARSAVVRAQEKLTSKQAVSPDAQPDKTETKNETENIL
jgi:hypothetical protein